MKEEVDYDPTKTEELNVKLNINDKKDKDGEPEWVIDGLMPWIIDDVEDRIQGIMGTELLTSLHIESLNCKSLVANEFLDLLCSYEVPDQGLEKLILDQFKHKSEPYQDEVVSRLASVCPRVSVLQLSSMDNLTEVGRLSIANMFR